MIGLLFCKKKKKSAIIANVNKLGSRLSNNFYFQNNDGKKDALILLYPQIKTFPNFLQIHGSAKSLIKWEIFKFMKQQ